ncbi:PQQ-binding-like beta-propeller repeat protein [bacterium]|nr:PQQ-binding-like beta-propeller repeat protein [bacterium]
MKWSFYTWGEINSSPAIGSDGTIYIGSASNYLYALNPDGTKKWAFNTGCDIYFSSPVIGVDGTIYLGSTSKFLFAINPDGSLKWKFATGRVMDTAPAIGDDGTIYFCLIDGYLYAVNPDGSLKWTFITGEYGNSPTIGSDGTIFFGNSQRLCAINPDSTLKWSFEPGGFNPSIASDGTIYFSESKNLYAVKPDGTLKWIFRTGEYIRSSPTIGSDGLIYVSSLDKYLYAINPDSTLRWKFYFQNKPTQFTYTSIGSDGTIYLVCDTYLYAINERPLGVDIYAQNRTIYYGDTIDIKADISNPSNDMIDLFIAIQLGLEGNEIYFWYPTWDTIPHLTEIKPGFFENTILLMECSSSIPEGVYTFHAALTEHISRNILDLDSERISIIARITSTPTVTPTPTITPTPS